VEPSNVVEAEVAADEAIPLPILGGAWGDASGEVGDKPDDIFVDAKPGGVVEDANPEDTVVRNGTIGRVLGNVMTGEATGDTGAAREAPAKTLPLVPVFKSNALLERSKPGAIDVEAKREDGNFPSSKS
jgi:hypothetical protein